MCDKSRRSKRDDHPKQIQDELFTRWLLPLILLLIVSVGLFVVAIVLGAVFPMQQGQTTNGY